MLSKNAGKRQRPIPGKKEEYLDGYVDPDILDFNFCHCLPELFQK